MAILVTGGAGYIGSHAVAALLERGEEVVVVDDLRTGHREALLTDRFYEGDICDDGLLDRIFTEQRVEAVMHFAALSVVGDSVREPLAYYANNLVAAQRLVAAMHRHGVTRMVFSSTAATYGTPAVMPIVESTPTVPTNPYGETKLAVERMLGWCEAPCGIRSVSLRYFNAAGAHPLRDLGADHRPETHLIPIVLQVALRQRPHVTVYGDDYDTPDGTCVRDYVHVVDLADAHVLALERLRASGPSTVYNLGSGKGFSVREVIDSARTVTGVPIAVETGARRPGDPPSLVASAERACAELGWQPRFTGLDDIIRSAWRWHRTHPEGYRTRVKQGA